MSNDNTGIEWTDATWNPVTGCSKVSDGCRFCYAETVSHRWGWTSKPWTHPHAAENVVMHPERLDQPLRWQKPRRIFVNSMSDLFHELVPIEFVDKVFGVMAGAPRHTFQVLTKRPERMREYLSDPETKFRIWNAGRGVQSSSDNSNVRHRDWYDLVPVAGPGKGPEWCYPAQWPLPNVWVGTSVEDQRVIGRVTDLVATPAALRFLSCEPLIGPLSLSMIDYNPPGTEGLAGAYSPLTGEWWPALGHPDDEYDGRVLDGPRLGWVIVGGESGANHRPINPQWVRTLRDECAAAGVPFFFKQWGGNTAKSGGKDLDGRTWEEMPALEAVVSA